MGICLPLGEGMDGQLSLIQGFGLVHARQLGMKQMMIMKSTITVAAVG